MRHLINRRLLRSQTGAETLLCLVGQCLNRGLRDDPPIAARDRGSGRAEARHQFGAQQFPFLPEQEGLCHCVLGTVDATGLQGLLVSTLSVPG